MDKPCYTKGLSIFIAVVINFWQREKDLNPHKQSQSLSCYPYTIPPDAGLLYPRACYLSTKFFSTPDTALYSGSVMSASIVPFNKLNGVIEYSTTSSFV